MLATATNRTLIVETQALFAKALDLEHPHRAVERQRHDVAYPYRLTGCGHAPAVEPHVTFLSERGRVGAGAHHARVPEPFVDALALQIRLKTVLYCLARAAA